MRRPAVIGALAVVALVVVIVIAAASGSGGGFPLVGRGGGGDPYTVRAIFDDASFAVSGEDVRIAGATVGSIQSLGVTASNQAAVTFAITNKSFAPFYANASCAIRPQSLIGEEYVDCTPGTSSAAPLRRIGSGPGAGDYLLPVTQTSSPIDFDIVQDISNEPVRQALSVVIDEFGTGLAARGSDLNQVIERADPALGQTDRVLKILASQNRTLAALAVNSDAVLRPLARERRQISDFVVQANRTSTASAARAAEISQTFRLFPSFLRQLRPLMADLGQLAGQGTPLLTSLGQSASSLDTEFADLAPFAAKARTSLIELGNAAQRSQADLVATEPLAQRLKALGTEGEPASANLDKLLTSFDTTGGIEQLMGLLFNGTAAANGYNSLGHYVRDEPLVSTCTNYATSPVSGCSADFASDAQSAGVRRPQTATDRIVAAAVKSTESSAPAGAALGGLLSFLIGGSQ